MKFVLACKQPITRKLRPRSWWTALVLVCIYTCLSTVLAA